MGDGNLKLPDKIIIQIVLDVELLASGISNKLDIKTKVVHDRNNQYILVKMNYKKYKILFKVICILLCYIK